MGWLSLMAEGEALGAGGFIGAAAALAWALYERLSKSSATEKAAAESKEKAEAEEEKARKAEEREETAQRRAAELADEGERVKLRNKEMDYIFRKYKERVEQGEKVNEDAKQWNRQLQNETIACRESLARKEEQLVSALERIKFLEVRLKMVEKSP